MTTPDIICQLVKCFEEYREIESIDGAIDRLVYELYGLSEEEIRIVEGE